jgi:hypothetical protein
LPQRGTLTTHRKPASCQSRSPARSGLWSTRTFQHVIVQHRPMGRVIHRFSTNTGRSTGATASRSQAARATRRGQPPTVRHVVGTPRLARPDVVAARTHGRPRTRLSTEIVNNDAKTRWRRRMSLALLTMARGSLLVRTRSPLGRCIPICDAQRRGAADPPAEGSRHLRCHTCFP